MVVTNDFGGKNMIYLNQTDPTTNEHLIIRNETPDDYLAVEAMTRAAFWNLYIPGCMEHYLVHQMRDTSDFIAPLDLVLTRNDQIVGNIMYTKATLTDETGHVKPVITFGPICVQPGYQRRGFSKLLINTSFELAKSLGHDTVIIFGMPANYVARGFRNGYDFHVGLPGPQYPTAMLVKELVPHVLDGHDWTYQESPVMEVTMADVEAFDNTLPPLKKAWQPSQEEFKIISHSFIQKNE